MSKLNPAIHSTVKRPFVRSAYNYDRDAASDACGLQCNDKSLAQQQFKDTNNPNYLIERFLTGQDLSIFNVRAGAQFGDFTRVPGSFHEAATAVADARSAFLELPAHIRSRFNNDPGQLLDFIGNSKNRDEAIELGLISKPKGEGAPALKQGKGATPPKGSSKPSGSSSNADEGGKGDE